MAAASYLLLIPHYLSGGLTPAGTTVTEGVQIPVGWVPTMAVDPQNTEAIQAFWNAGPLPDAEPNRDLYWSAPPVQQALVYWSAVPGVSNYFVLTGAGAVLGTKNAPTPQAGVTPPPPVLPSTPVLSLVSVVGAVATFTIDVDNTIGAGDIIELQVQVAGGNWSVLVADSIHTITAPEDAANEIDLSLGLGNGSYEARADVTDIATGQTSMWSNTVPFTVSGVISPNVYFLCWEGI